AMNERLGRLQHLNRVTLLPANGILCQEDHTFRAGFFEENQRGVGGEGRVGDFKGGSEGAGGEIGGWMSRGTRGRLKGPAAGLDANTELVLCNTIYFKGEWAEPFRKNQTVERPFHVTAERSVSAPMMHRKGEYKLAETHYDDEHFLHSVEL